ncbi:MAG: SRPBCC family protein [Solirubrobacterales bacterium]
MSESIVLRAPPERVWETVMDPSRLGEWVTTHVSVEADTAGPVGEGDAFRQRLRLSGKAFDVDWKVVEAEAPTVALWRGDGPAGSVAEVSYRLEPAEGGTRFEYQNSFALPGGVLGKLAGGALAARAGRREARRSLENLRRLLEARPLDSPAASSTGPNGGRR